MKTPIALKIGVPLRLAVIYALFGSVWILVSDWILQGLAPNHYVFNEIGTWKGQTFILFSALVVYLAAGGKLLKPISDAPMSRAEPQVWWLVMIMAVAASAMFATSLGWITYSAGKLKRIEGERLQAIADFKVRRIESWLGERFADAQALRATVDSISSVTRCRHGDAGSCRELLKHLEIASARNEYRSVLLLDEHGGVLLSAGETNHAQRPTLPGSLQQALASGKVVATDLYRGAGDGPGSAQLDFIVPLSNGRLAVILRVDPDRVLYPELRTWPVPSETAETLLFRQDGEHVLYLNDLRHRANSALDLRVPLSDKDILAVQTVDGSVQAGDTVEGIDYREVSVLGAVRKISHMPWYLIAKQDDVELYASVRQEAKWITAANLLILILVAIAGSLILQRRKLQLQEVRQEADAQRLQALSLLDAIAESSTDLIFAKDVDGRYLQINRAGCSFLGKTCDEVLGRDATALYPPDEAARIMARDQLVMREERVADVESTLTTASGQTILHATIGPLRDAAGQVIGVFGIARDITERRAAEETLRKLWLAIEQSPNSIMITDLDGRIEYVNDTFTQVSGYRADEVVGRNQRFLASGETRASTAQGLWAALAIGQSWKGEFINRRKNGES